jgi:hypothetical protein
MSFDKIKVMRNAERYLAQGKIRAAISEYKRVVESDPKDFSTLNILGDLYLKNSEEKEAVGCFTQVAEHYNSKGFLKKQSPFTTRSLDSSPTQWRFQRNWRSCIR